MQYSKNLKLNLPERNDQYNLDHWNENTNNIDELIYQNQLNISQNQNDISKIFNGLDTKNVNDTDSVYYKLMKLIYPVGSLYWSSKDTNPSQLFGGTWTQIKDKFILAAGDTYTNGSIGGESTVTLTTTQIPSHRHTGPSHTHYFTAKGSVGSHAHNMDHYHNFDAYDSNGTYNGWAVLTPSSRESFITNYYNQPASQQSTLQYAGKTGNNTPSFTGTRTTTESAGTGNTGYTGGGESHNNMPPYIVKYCWERTA